MVYILSRIVDKLFFRSAALAVKEHSDFALLGADHNRLILNLLYQYHPALFRKKRVDGVDNRGPPRKKANIRWHLFIFERCIIYSV